MSEWWRGAVFYQIYPRSFQDTTGNGVGDIPGITRRLDHVAALGAEAVWISPVFPSPQADMGYDVSDYTGIDPLFGTLADFDAMLARAHALGLKVIVDQVLSHTSSAHQWFVESRASRDNPRADWYVWADPKRDATPPNNWQSIFSGPAWEWEPRRQQYYFHNFLAAQPDLNFHNPAVQDALLDAVRFWLERGVDGFRLDTANFYFHDARLRDDPPDPKMAGRPWQTPYSGLRHIHSKTQPENIAFLRRLRALCDRYGAALVGEIGDEDRSLATMAEYTRGGDRLHMAYSFELLGPEFTAAHVRSRVEGFFAAAPDGWPWWSFSNHDVNRHLTRWAAHGHDPQALARQCALLLATLPGTIGLYQGEELGLTETDLEFHELTDPPGIRLWPEYKGRDGCRTPIPWDDSAQGGFTTGTPWLPLKPPQRARNARAQAGQPGSTLEHYRATLAFRRAHPVLRTAATRFHDLPEPLLACERGTGAGALTCVFNLSPVPQRLRVEGAAQPLPVSQAAGLTGATLALGPNGCAILPRADEGTAIQLHLGKNTQAS